MKLTKWLLIATEVFLPLYVIRCKNFSICENFSPIPFTFLEILILLTSASWIAWKYLDIKRGQDSLSRLSQRLKSPLLTPIAFFLLAGLMGVFVSPDLRGAAGIYKAYFIEGFLLYIVALDLAALSGSFTFLLAGLVGSGVWLASLSTGEWLLKINPTASWELLRARVSGVYTTSNALGLYLGPLLALSLGWLVDSFQKTKKASFTLIIASLLIAGGVYVSGSRGAFLGLGFGLVSVIALTLSKNFFGQKWFSKLFLAIFLGVLTLLFVLFVNFSLFAPKHFAANSAESRLCFWQGTRSLLQDKPLFGTGLNGFRLVYPGYETCSYEINEYPHNIFLNFWTQVGLLGLLSFLWINLQLVLGLIKNKKNLIFKISLITAVVVIFGHGLVDVPFFKNDLAAEFWLLLAFGNYLIFKDLMGENQPH